MFLFLQALDLEILTVDDVANKLGPVPWVGDIVRAGISQADATVVLFTPDEFAVLDGTLQQRPQEEGSIRWQSRPNVIFEAGLALGLSPDKTIITTLGSDVSLFSDIQGLHVVRLDNTPATRDRLRDKLSSAGCLIHQKPHSYDKSMAGDFSERPTRVGRIVQLVKEMEGSLSVRSIPELGVRNIFAVPAENSERDTRMRQILEGRGPFRLLARSGFSYLHDSGPNYRLGLGAHISRETRIDVLLENPYSDAAQHRYRAEAAQGAYRWGKIPPARYWELQNRKSPNLTIRFTDVPIHCSLFFAADTVVYDPYHFGRLGNAQRIGNQFIVIEFERPQEPPGGANDYYSLLEDHFNFLWSRERVKSLQDLWNENSHDPDLRPR